MVTSHATNDEVEHVHAILRFLRAIPFTMDNFRWSVVIAMLALARLKGFTYWNFLVLAAWGREE